MSADEIDEPILDPDLPIIDPHHHLWWLPKPPQSFEPANEMARAMVSVLARFPRYAADELVADLTSGHNVRATVGIEARVMYRVDGPRELRSRGEIEFLNGVAAVGASGVLGDIRPCAGIVGGVDLSFGDKAEAVILRQMEVAGGRYRGVRAGDVAYDEDETIRGPGAGRPHLLLDPQFRAGLTRLQALGLSFDVWLFEPQLPDLLDLAAAFPDLPIILNHVGSPLGVGRYAGRLPERFPIWQESIRKVSRFENVVVKLGGLGMPLRGMTFERPLTSEALAKAWKPYFETCIEAFGTDRCMFESNFPPDMATCSYRLLWNAFKRIASGASASEKRALFHDNAARAYRLDVQLPAAAARHCN